jgi:hypothetical protein
VPVRPSESRLPAGFQLEDLGQSVSTADNKASLISYNPSPVANGRRQAYVVFVTDNALAAQVAHYDWSIQNGTATVAATTESGYHEFTTQEEGSLSAKVTVKDAADQPLGELTLDQVVLALNAELEALYEQTAQSVPLVGQPETSREIVNDLRSTMDDLAPRDADPSSSMSRLLFAISYAETLDQPVERRNPALEMLADGFAADDPTAFVEEGRAGIGVCRIRPHALAMFLPETPGGNDWYLPQREFPTEEANRLTLERQLAEELKGLAREKQIDLFNLLRFPRSNFKMAMQLLEGARGKYLGADNTETVIKDKDKALLLLDQFKNGPYAVV